MILLSSKKFRKGFKKLPQSIRVKSKERVDLFQTNQFHPLLDNHLLHGEYAGCRSINITGDYRAIFYHEGIGAVRFIAIGTHHELFGT